MGQYRYNRYRPAKHRMMADETTEHKYAFNKRTDILLPVSTPGRVRYLAECTCGWKDRTEEFHSTRVAHARWEAHMLVVAQQQRFPV